MGRNYIHFPSNYNLKYKFLLIDYSVNIITVTDSFNKILILKIKF